MSFKDSDYQTYVLYRRILQGYNHEYQQNSEISLKISNSLHLFLVLHAQYMHPS